MDGYVKHVGVALTTVSIAVGIFFLQQLCLAMAGYLHERSLSIGLGEAIRLGAEAPFNLALAQAAAIALVFAVAFPHKAREPGFLEAVHVRPLAGLVVAVCFGAGLCLQFPLAELGNFSQEIWPLSFDEVARRHRLVTPATWWGGMSALIAFVLVAPVSEELVFRGWFLPMLERRWGAMPALLWTSLLFGLMHGGAGVLYATVAGLVLGAVALRTRSTLASIALHAGVNATPLLLPVSLIRIPGFNTLSERVEHIHLGLLLVSIVLSAALVALLWRVTEDA